VYGYIVLLVQEWVAGRFDALPEFQFGENLSRGFFMFLKSVPLYICAIGVSLIMSAAGDFGAVAYFVVAALTLPMLTMNLYVEESVRASFDIDVLAPVFTAFGDYLLVLLKALALAIVFLFMSLVLVGIPASYFTQHIFMADFYRRHIGE
jgi:hypothetical protein